MKDVLYTILGIIIFFGLITSCSSPSTVSNDWDADGDSFDQGDYNKFIEYKNQQDYSEQNW